MKRSLFCILLVAGILLPATNAFAQTAQPPAGSIGIGLLEAPVSRQNDPRAQSYIVDHVSQGTTIQRKIQVTNTTTSPQTIQLYAGAASIANGEFSTAEGHGANDLTGWTSVNPPIVTVPPGQAAQAEVTIAIPREA